MEGAPTPNSAIQLPFIIVNTSKKTVIDCSISNDKMEYLFNFDDTFEIHDDMEVRVASRPLKSCLINRFLGSQAHGPQFWTGEGQC